MSRRKQATTTKSKATGIANASNPKVSVSRSATNAPPGPIQLSTTRPGWPSLDEYETSESASKTSSAKSTMPVISKGKE